MLLAVDDGRETERRHTRRKKNTGERARVLQKQNSPIPDSRERAERDAVWSPGCPSFFGAGLRTLGGCPNCVVYCARRFGMRDELAEHTDLTLNKQHTHGRREREARARNQPCSSLNAERISETRTNVRLNKQRTNGREKEAHEQTKLSSSLNA